MSIYRQFGVEPIINASGTLTRLGGGLLPDAVIEAMKQAAQSTVRLEELQAAASRIIARAAGTEAGLVTSGASAALTLGAAAILAGRHLSRIDHLPRTEEFPSEFLVARDQRNGYDHAVRAAGARLVDVGMNESVAGSGVRGVEVWEYEACRRPSTAGVLYVYREGASPSLAEVVAWAHGHGLAVLVDAAAELNRRHHLQSIPGTGADLIAFSGGKAIRGPQASGILCGRRDLIESAAIQMLDLDVPYEDWNPPADFIDRSRWPALPRQGIGRGFKVAKEQIVGLLVALEWFTQSNGDAEAAATLQRATRIAHWLVEKRITSCPERVPGTDEVLVRVPLISGMEPARLVAQLRQQTPAVHARCDATGQELLLNLASVRADQDRMLAERVAEAWAALIAHP